MKKQHKQNHKQSEIKSGSHISLRNVGEQHWQENPGNIWTNWNQPLTSWWPIAKVCNLVSNASKLVSTTCNECGDYIYEFMV